MLAPAPVTLSGRHVRLEPLRPEHAEPLCAIGIEPALWRYYIAPMRGPEDMQAYVDEALREQAAGRALPFVQLDAASGRIAGSTRFGNIDVHHGRIEIGWTWLAPRWQRSGINTEAKLLLLSHAFETLGCRRVELKADARNAPSRAAMERIGAQYEGTLRRHMRCGDGFQRDSVYYAFIAEEWPARKAALEQLLR